MESAAGRSLRNLKMVSKIARRNGDAYGNESLRLSTRRLASEEPGPLTSFLDTFVKVPGSDTDGTNMGQPRVFSSETILVSSLQGLPAMKENRGHWRCGNDRRIANHGTPATTLGAIH